MKYIINSHCDGESHFPDRLRKDIHKAIDGVDVKIKRGAATSIRDVILDSLHVSGWSGELLISPDSNITITSTKNKVGLCLQTGNMARMYADMLKLQALYLNAVISSGAFILPSPNVAKILGSNVANASRLERELEIFKKVFNLPTLIFSLEE